MKTIEMKCKKCGADLVLDLDHLQAYCQYCGSKLFLDINNLEHLLSEKERSKQSLNYLKKEKEKTKQISKYFKYRSNKDSFEFKIIIALLIMIVLSVLFLSAIAIKL